MKDATIRAVRTFFQGFIGILALLAIPRLTSIVDAAIGGNEINLSIDVWQSVVVAAIAGGLIALISFVQNELEDASGKSFPAK